MKLKSPERLEHLREEYMRDVEQEIGGFDTDINRAVAEAGFPKKAVEAKDNYLKATQALERAEKAQKKFDSIDLESLETERDRLGRKAEETHTRNDKEHQDYRKAFQALDNFVKKFRGDTELHKLSLMDGELPEEAELKRREVVANILQASGLLNESSEIARSLDHETAEFVLEERRELLELAETAEVYLRKAEYFRGNLEKKED